MKINLKRIKSLERAIKLNKQEIKTNPSPHERDVARFRIKLFKNKIRELRSHEIT